MRKFLLMIVIGILGISNVVKADNKQVIQALEKINLQVQNIKPSPIPSLFTVSTNSGIFYVSADGRYLLQGQLYDISGGTPVNLLYQELVVKLEELTDEMIIYKALIEKHVVTIFTDNTCGYCVKLHKEMPEYNKLGITVRYLAFPRQGIESDEFNVMQSIWCASDRNKAFNEAILGKKTSMKTCKIDIGQHYQLGIELGVTGTPAIVTKEGLLPGYIEAKKLLELLNSMENR